MMQKRMSEKKAFGGRVRGAWAVAAAVVLGSSALTVQAKLDEEYWLPPDVYPLRVGLFPPVQLPVPWMGYDEDTPWDVFSVYGLDLAVIWAANINLYGLGVGGYMNTSRDLCGLEANVVGRTRNAYGVQVGVWNWDTDVMYGIQAGGINAVGDAAGLQVGVWDWTTTAYGLQAGGINMAREAGGLQVGLWNWTTKASGLQIGGINWTDEMYGVQIGLVNVITKGSLKAMVIANAKF